VDVYDLKGRRLESTSVMADRPGGHTLFLGRAAQWEAGVYLVRARFKGEDRTLHLVLVK
jgi:hypothetical protein